VFAGQTTLLDSQLGRLFNAVREGKTAVARQWAVLVVGVRGLPLGLHGWVGVGGRDLPYGELVHVPAIFVDAAGRMAAQRYGGLVVPADLGCTLADLVSLGTASLPQAAVVDPSEPWKGASLVGLFEHWSAPVRNRVIVAGTDGAAIVTPEWHGLLETGAAPAGVNHGHERRIRLFAKPDDFYELADVANRCADVAGPLGDLLERACAGDREAAWLTRMPEATSE
jgi:hypothetical protein